MCHGPPLLWTVPSQGGPSVAVSRSPRGAWPCLADLTGCQLAFACSCKGERKHDRMCFVHIFHVPLLSLLGFAHAACHHMPSHAEISAGVPEWQGLTPTLEKAPRSPPPPPPPLFATSSESWGALWGGYATCMSVCLMSGRCRKHTAGLACALERRLAHSRLPR